MKAKKAQTVTDCVDAINQHRCNAWAVAELLTMCDNVGSDSVHPKAVGYAAYLIVDELEQVGGWMKKLEEVIRK